MDKQQHNEQWEQAKKQIKEQYPHVDIDDLEYNLDKREELLEKLQMKLGKTKKEINDWLRIMG
jgi:oligoribonuclease NrnB/cAMP/cGMP phosphodiesterase (DHH superfamily)